MKKHLAKMGLLAFALAGATVPSASAANSTTHAAAFHAYNASQVADIDYVFNAVYNKASGVRPVIAPINMVPNYGFTPPSNVKFWVDGVVGSGVASLTWTIYAYNPDGSFVASGSGTKTGSGLFDVPTFLTNGLVNVDDYISLYAELPANTSTRFFGVLQMN